MLNNCGCFACIAATHTVAESALLCPLHTLHTQKHLEGVLAPGCQATLALCHCLPNQSSNPPDACCVLFPVCSGLIGRRKHQELLLRHEALEARLEVLISKGKATLQHLNTAVPDSLQHGQLTVDLITGGPHLGTSSMPPACVCSRIAPVLLPSCWSSGLCVIRLVVEASHVVGASWVHQHLIEQGWPKTAACSDLALYCAAIWDTRTTCCCLLCRHLQCC